MPGAPSDRPFLLLIVVATSALSGCRGVDDRAERAYFSGERRAAIDLLRDRADTDVMAYALTQSQLASVALQEQRFDVAEAALLEAAKLTDDVGGVLPDPVAAADRRKAGYLYRNHPHERVLNAIYRSLLAIARNDLETAATSIEPVWASAPESARSDSEAVVPDWVSTAHALDAWIDQRRGRPLSAELHRTLVAPPVGPLPERALRSNVLVWIDTDWGPRRVLPEGETQPRYEAMPARISRLEARVDGESIPLVTSLDVGAEAKQAATGRDRASVKLIGDDNEVVGGLVSVFNQSLRLMTVWAQAPQDTRHWTWMPGLCRLSWLQLEPGPHLVEIRGFDDSGDEWSDLRVTRTIEAGDGVTLVYARLSPPPLPPR
ncbi:MAG: hypothetical protein KDC38_08705 [Planctomycetes bacterium]|nr:hypothetical protein [Planctomycetota bacterium]